MSDDPIKSSSEPGQILGLPEGNYFKFMYIALLIAAAISILAALGALAGTIIPGGNLAGLIGLAGLVMAAVAWLGFRAQISALNASHAKYVLILVLASIVLNIAVGAIFGVWGFIPALMSFLVSSAYLVLTYAGFKLWQSGVLATKDTVIAQVKEFKSKILKTP